jgi:hypothetical protein
VFKRLYDNVPLYDFMCFTFHDGFSYLGRRGLCFPVSSLKAALTRSMSRRNDISTRIRCGQYDDWVYQRVAEEGAWRWMAGGFGVGLVCIC